MKLSPLPPDAPPALTDLREGVQELSEPTLPHRIFACLEAQLPPAPSFTYCVLFVSDLVTLAISNGVDWIRQDTGTAI